MHAHKNRIVIVVTSHAELGETGKKTGYHLEELAVPYLEFKRAGAEIVIASPKGGTPPVDPKSAQKDSPEIQEFLQDPEARSKMKSTLKLSEVKGDIDAIFFPGGHGPMWDLAKNDDATDLIEQVWRDGGVVAALCHGPSALLNARDERGEPLVRGKRINAFTDNEEIASGLHDVVPFHLEEELRALGAKFESSPKMQAHVARDGQLVTGQNPASAKGVAQEILRALESERADVDEDREGRPIPAETRTPARTARTSDSRISSQGIDDESLDDGRLLLQRRVSNEDGERASNGRVINAQPDDQEISSRYADSERISSQGSESGHSQTKLVHERGLPSPELSSKKIVAREADSGRTPVPDGADDRLPAGLTGDDRQAPNPRRRETLGRGEDRRMDSAPPKHAGELLHDDLPREQRAQKSRTEKQEGDSSEAAHLAHKEGSKDARKNPRNPRRN